MTLYGLNILDPLVDWPSGVKHIRLWDCGVAWKDLNPADGVFEWGRLDAIVAKAEASGVKSICLTIAATPTWAAKYPSNPHAAAWLGAGSNSPPKDMIVWDTFIWHVSTRYKGRIKFYQIGNEPQLADFWFPYEEVNTLGTMAKRAKSIISKTDPTAKIVSAPVLPRPSGGGMKRANRYLTSLADNRWPVDVLAAHIYPEIGTHPARWGGLAKMWTNALARIDAPIRPTWVTETTFNLLGGPLSASEIVTSLREADRAADSLGIDRIYYYAYGTHSDPKVLGVPLTAESAGMKELLRLSGR